MTETPITDRRTQPTTPPRSPMGGYLGPVPQSPRRNVGRGGLLPDHCSLIIIGPFLYWNDPNLVPTGRDFLTLRDTRPIYMALWDAEAKVNWAASPGHRQSGPRHAGPPAVWRAASRIAVGLAAMLLSSCSAR